MRFEIYGYRGNWRWHLMATNGKIIAQGESYKRIRDAKHCIELLKRSRAASVVIVESLNGRFFPRGKRA